MQIPGWEGLGMCTSIGLMGGSQPSRLTPERAPMVVEGFDIKLHDPVRTAILSLAQLLTSLVGTAFRSEPVRAVSEASCEDWLKLHLRGSLDHAISDGAYSYPAQFSV